MSNFELLDSQFGEENPVRTPRAARAAHGHHIYDPQVINNKVVGYRAVHYEHQDFPMMVYRKRTNAITEEEWKALNHGKTSLDYKKFLATPEDQIVNNDDELQAALKSGWFLDTKCTVKERKTREERVMSANDEEIKRMKDQISALERKNSSLQAELDQKEPKRTKPVQNPSI